MSTGKERKKSAQKDDDSEEMTKYAVACKCAEGHRPHNAEMTKLADGTHQCPHCGRRHV